MNYLVDTNIFIRFLTRDVPEQADKIEKFFLKASQGKISLSVTNFTIVEVLYILESWYKLKKDDAVSKIQTLITPDWIGLEKKEIILEALQIYIEENIDFVDILNFVFAKERELKILSFDKDFDKLIPKLRVEP